MNRFMEEVLNTKIKSGLYREPRQQDLIDFSSNDYLGLAHSQLFFEAVQKKTEQQSKLQKNKVGSTGSRLLTGHSNYLEEVEEKIAQFHQAEASLIFSSGFLANVGLISTVAHPKAALIFDAEHHASVIMGIKSGKSNSFPFRHNDVDHLEVKLKQTASYTHRFVCVQSIYSCDGSTPPFNEFVSLCHQYQAQLIVDEAHATGIVGKKGEGWIQHLGLQGEVFARVHTFSKALGAMGGAVIGSKLLKRYLLNQCYAQFYTTAPSLFHIAAIDCCYDVFPQMNEERESLRKNQRHFGSESPLYFQTYPGNKNVMEAAKQFQEKGFAVSPLRSPTVRRGTEKIRIVIHAFNREEEIHKLKEYLRDLRDIRD